MTRAETLDRAKQCICGQRENEYGSPKDNFRSIAALWSVYKNTDFTATDVAMMMALLKIARIKTGTATEDSFVDLAGYAACGAEIALGATANTVHVEAPQSVVDIAIDRAVNRIEKEKENI